MAGQGPPLRLHICVSHHHLSLEPWNISASADETLATQSKHPHRHKQGLHSYTLTKYKISYKLYDKTLLKLKNRKDIDKIFSVLFLNTYMQ